MNKMTAAICSVLAFGSVARSLAHQQDVSFIARRDFATGAGPISMAVGDFNRDGVPDLAVGDEYQAEISVLLGNVDGTFQPAMDFAAGGIPRSLAVGDFNGDGVQDLAVANQLEDRVSVFLGNGDGTFQPALRFEAGPRPFSERWELPTA